MGRRPKPITRKMKEASCELSDNLLHTDEFYKLFEYYAMYVDGGGKESGVIKLFEEAIEKAFWEGTEHSLETATLDKLLSLLDRTKTWQGQVEAIRAISAQRRGKKVPEVARLNKEKKYFKPIKFNLPPGSILALRHIAEQMRTDQRFISPEEKKKIRAIINRNRKLVKEEVFIFDTLKNMTYSPHFKFRGTPDERMDLIQKAFENLLVNGNYNPTLSRGEKINFMKGCLKTARDSILKSQKTQRKLE